MIQKELEILLKENHLFGFLLPQSMNQNQILKELIEQKIYISLRGKAIRVSTHLYNDPKDISVLIEGLNKLG